MNRFRQTVFVEGVTELVFVRELIRKWYNYDSTKVGFQCYDLRNKQRQSRPYEYGSKESECYYQIISTGNDNKVVQEVVSQSPSLHGRGFCVVGLRDMYSQEYVRQAKRGKGMQVDPVLNQRFFDGVKHTLERELPKEILSEVNVCFAIMEVEAWLLALMGQEKQPEQIYHPAVRMKELNDRYDKHEEQINSLFSQFDNSSFEKLYNSHISPSFNTFFDILIPEYYR